MSKDIISINERPKLTIIKAQTGLGKSHAYIEYALADGKCSKLIVAPTNDLKDQIFNDCVAKYGYGNFMKTPKIPKFKVEEIQERVENLYAMGLHSAVKRFLSKKKVELKKKDKINKEEESDLQEIELYLEQNKRANKFEGNVITTHDRIFYFTSEFFNTHKIVIDEDIMKKSLKITKISMRDIMAFSSKNYEIFKVVQDRIMQITNADYEKTVQLTYNSVTENKIVKEVKDEVYDFDIMTFFKAKAFWKYNPRKEVMENLKSLRDGGDLKSCLPNSTDEIYFLEIRDLPLYDTVVFSATSDKGFYENLFWGFDVKEFDVGEVKLKGKIKQFPTSSCSRYDLEQHPKKIKEIIKKYPQIEKEQIITFLRYKESDKALNFGNTEGKNILERKRFINNWDSSL